ncbi:hypothetical protein [Aeromicrobium yanjiei]|uniref:Uncharacterized protein n=1 Tax=Aeromicrobium yanjiei TaxID=2662028 RepID=A0A5Q2ME23_9ACTN|nr:hypothetical protein [Aeromicrobium yanjiei]QGG39891.1 hypothetical protein GEV26_00030 [Aeromicrobium yanjiei]
MSDDPRRPTLADFLGWGVEQGVFTVGLELPARAIAEHAFGLIKAQFALVTGAPHNDTVAKSSANASGKVHPTGSTHAADESGMSLAQFDRVTAQRRLDEVENILHQAVDVVCNVHADRIAADYGVATAMVIGIFNEFRATIEQADLLGVQLNHGLETPIPSGHDLRYLASEIGPNGIDVPEWVLRESR